MEFRVLGPLEVQVGEQRLRLAGLKQRAVLAVLLAHANRVVPVDRLVDMVWGESAPATAAVQVQGHVSALRRLITDAGVPREVIVTRPPGYLIRVEPEELDLEVFDRHAEEARVALAASRFEDAAAGFRRALLLWRGGPFSDVAETVMPAEAARLEERRLVVLEERIDADLALGRYLDLVPELTALTNEYPLRERLHAQLMIALYRCGRQADALAAYRNARTLLVEELGLEPGEELRRVEQSILSGGADDEPDTPVVVPPLPALPAQLPADVADFTGRAKLVSQVSDQLSLAADEEERPQAVVVSAVAGKAGVGKTTLAVHVAHHLSASFPDGQLHVNLRGAEAHPVEPAKVLDRFLHALGIDGAVIPDTVEERAALYRSCLASRRLLVLLDDAADEAQVRPLLPGAASCAVLITSRGRLVGLEGASQLDLDVLTRQEAVELLARVAGWQRVAAEPAAAEQIVRLCGQLPLAVRIAGARLSARPHWSLDRLASILSDERRRLDELKVGDLEVRTSLTPSYEGLDPTARSAFRRLGQLQAPDFASWVVAALLDVPASEAEQVVERLVDAQLLEVAGHDTAGQQRYRLHDLLGVYGRERVRAEDSPVETEQALTRTLGGWLALAHHAGGSLQGSVPWIQHGHAQRWEVDNATTEAVLADPLTWFESERPALIAAVEQAAASDLSEFAWDIANVLAFFLQLRGRFGDWRYTHDVALGATQRTGDRRGAAIMLRGLSEVHTFQDRYEEALRCLERAQTGFREAGDLDGEADVQCGFGVVYRLQGRPQESVQANERALALLSEVSDRPDKAYALLGTGMGLLEQDRLDDAEAYVDKALASFRAVGYRHGEAQALHRLGNLLHARGRLPEAVVCLQQAVTIFADVGERHSNAYALLALGQTQIDQDQPQQAETLLEQCLDTFRELGDRVGEACALHSLGDVYCTGEELAEAITCYTRSAEIWHDLDLPLRQAKALANLGDVHAATGDLDAARTARLEALRLFREHEAVEADDLALRLEE